MTKETKIFVQQWGRGCREKKPFLKILFAPELIVWPNLMEMPAKSQEYTLSSGGKMEDYIQEPIND